jgi:iron complex transport system ATP-binding protein
MSGLLIRNLSVSLKGRLVLDGVAFEAPSGKVTGLVGPNGAGKSTLLRAATGLVPYQGEVSVSGLDLKDYSRTERAKIISYLPQIPEVHWPLRAFDVVALGRYPFGGMMERLQSRDLKAIEAAFKAVDGGHLKDRNILNLSAGERARILLARALAVEAPVLLVDEPVASLDPEHQLKVMAVLRGLAKKGRAVVVVLHDLTLASRFCDQLTLVNKGRVIASGQPRNVLNPKNLKSVYKITAKRDKNWLIPWSLSD